MVAAAAVPYTTIPELARTSGMNETTLRRRFDDGSLHVPRIRLGLVRVVERKDVPAVLRRIEELKGH